MKIEKGKKYLCIKDVIMKNGPYEGEKAFTKGHYYSSTLDGHLINNFLNARHECSQIDFCKENFAEAPEAPQYYNNEKGSLYKIAEQRGWSPYAFDVVKRLDRGGKKDPLKQEIEKSIFVLHLWLKELED